MKTVIGLFDYASDAYAAQGDLVGSGLDTKKISVVTSTANKDYKQEHTRGGGNEASEGAGIGATAGAIAGGAAGLLASLGLLAIPGIGPLLAAGPIVAILTGAGIGAAAGGLAGGLIGLGIPEHEAEVYEEGIHRGGTLVTVEASDAEADRIASVLSQHNAVDIDKRASEWETAGWQRKYATPDSSSESINARSRGVERAADIDDLDVVDEGIPAESAGPRRGTSAKIYNPR